MTRPQDRFYVYLYRDPRPGKDLQPFYVGKGKGRRSHDHLINFERYPDQLNSLMRNVLGKIFKTNLDPVIEIVSHFDEEVDAFRFEIELIARYGRRDIKTGSLCNLTDGGEGASGSLVTAERGRETMLKLHSDPEFKKAHSERGRKTLLMQHADPKFRKAQAERGREMFRKLNAVPEFKKAQAERGREMLRRLNAERNAERNANPAFQAKRIAGIRAAAERRRLAKEDQQQSWHEKSYVSRM